MKNIIENYKTIFKNMNTASKYSIKYGSVLVATLFTAALYFFITAESGSDPFFNIHFCEDLLYSAKECISSVFILPMIGEIIYMAGRIK